MGGWFSAHAHNGNEGGLKIGRDGGRDGGFSAHAHNGNDFAYRFVKVNSKCLKLKCSYRFVVKLRIEIAESILLHDILSRVKLLL